MALLMKPHPWKCGTCYERAVSPAVIPCYHARLDHDGRTYEIEIADYHVFRCSRCGAVQLDDEAEERLTGALRAAAGLLEPSVIRARREALGLTQRELAGLLLIAESTLSRWETGAQIQQRVMDRLLRAFFELEPLREYLKSLDSSSVPAVEPARQPPRHARSVGLAEESRGSSLPTETASPRPAS